MVEVGTGVATAFASVTGAEIDMEVGAGVGMGTSAGTSVVVVGKLTVGFDTGVKVATEDAGCIGCVSGRTNGDCVADMPCPDT